MTFEQIEFPRRKLYKLVFELFCIYILYMIFPMKKT